MEALDSGKKVIANRRRHMPTWDALQEECGAAPVITNGKGFARIEGKENVRRWVEMTNEWRQAEIERGAEMSAAVPTESFTARDGRRVTVPAQQAEKVARHRGIGVSGRRVPLEHARSLACRTCGYNRMMGRCTCEEQS